MTALHVLRDIILVHKLLQPIRIQPRRHLAMDVLKEANHSGKKRNKVRSVQVICTCSLCFHLLAADTTVSTRSDVWNWDAEESRRAWRSASQREPRSMISRLSCPSRCPRRVTQATKEQQIGLSKRIYIYKDWESPYLFVRTFSHSFKMPTTTETAGARYGKGAKLVATTAPAATEVMTARVVRDAVIVVISYMLMVCRE